MQFLEMIKKETSGIRRDIIIASSVSGIANASLLAIINLAAQKVDEGGSQFRELLLFAVAFTLFVVCLKYTFDKSANVFETLLHRVRVRIAEKIKRSELETMDQIGREVIYNRLTQETATISQSQSNLIAALQSVVMVLFVSLYIAYLSKPAFVLTLAMTMGAVGIFLVKEKETNLFLDRATQKEVELIGAFTHLLDGFKQIKVRDRLGEDLVGDIRQISEDVRDLKVQTSRLYNNNNIFAQCFFYLLIATIVFLLPKFVTSYTDVLNELTASILFIIGPLGLVVTAIPTLARANRAAKNINDLEVLLDKQNREKGLPAKANTPSAFADFQEITAENLAFSFFDEEGHRSFEIGPIDLTIQRGECLFIIGGNGSGKSTFLKLLTGLYPASRGFVKVDGEPITPKNLQEYRELYSVIFGDFHLFHKLYGLPEIERKLVVDHIKDMELHGKTDFDGAQFSNLNLSTGQRKRIALIVSKLEDRPLFVFDEWAADQDPQFRKRFYLELLPAFIEMGKTVIAVTHDDHFFKAAHRIVKLDYGKIDYIKTPEKI